MFLGWIQDCQWKAVELDVVNTAYSEVSILMVKSLSQSLSGQVDAVHWSVYGQCDLQFFSLHDESGIPLMFVDWVRQVKAQLTKTKNMQRYIYISSENWKKCILTNSLLTTLEFWGQETSPSHPAPNQMLLYLAV